MSLLNSIRADAAAYGDSTRVVLSAQTVVTDGADGDTVKTSTTAVASGDIAATTDITTVTAADDGSGATVETDTGGSAVGDDALSSSVTQSLATSDDDGADAVTAITGSTASGEDDATADASVVPEGGITDSSETSFETEDEYTATATGIAIDPIDPLESGAFDAGVIGFDPGFDPGVFELLAGFA